MTIRSTGVLVFVSLLQCSCGALLSDAGVTKKPPRSVTFVVEHRGDDYDICSVQLAQPFRASWQENLLQNGARIRRGEERELPVDADGNAAVAIRVQDCEQRVIYQAPDVRLGTPPKVLTLLAKGGASWATR
jgi:hypothetical protein